MTTTTIHPDQIMPMRYESAEVANIDHLIDDPTWALEQKLDGIRVLTRVVDGKVSFHASNGAPMASSTAVLQLRGIDTLLDRLGLQGDWAIDGEIVDGVLWLFDLPLGLAGAITPSTPFARRREALEMLEAHAIAGDAEIAARVRVVPCRRRKDDKAELWSSIVTAGAEGVCAKRLDGTYLLSGARHVRSRDVVKVKITHTVDVIVTARNVRSDCSAELAIHTDDGLVPIGACSMIGKPDAQPGDVVEMRCLYVQPPSAKHPYGCLYQPTLLRIRDDKTAAECGPDQLRYPDRTVIA